MCRDESSELPVELVFLAGVLKMKVIFLLLQLILLLVLQAQAKIPLKEYFDGEKVMLPEGFPMVEDREDALLGHGFPEGAEVRQNPPACFCKDPSSCWTSKSLRLPGIQQHKVWVLERLSGAVSGLVRVTGYLGLAKWILHWVSSLWQTAVVPGRRDACPPCQQPGQRREWGGPALSLNLSLLSVLISAEPFL